jgi:hypothetical protein
MSTPAMKRYFLMVSFREKQGFPQYPRRIDSIKMSLLVKVGRILIMKALKFSVLLPLLIIALLTSCAQMNRQTTNAASITRNDHDALIRYYGDLAREAKTKLLENKRMLEECESHPYYFGWQGQDIRSHSAANILRYEKILEESLRHADVHRRMAKEQENQMNRTESDLEDEFTAAESEYPGSKAL